MKLLLALGLLALTLNVFATEVEENVLVEHATYVGFAPVEYRGTFKWQILTTGEIQEIDNKENKTIIAKLSSAVMANLTSEINKIKSDELIEPATLPCFDAPSSDITVQQEGGKNLTIWKRSGCRDYPAKDSVAAKVGTAINTLRIGLGQVNHIDE